MVVYLYLYVCVCVCVCSWEAVIYLSMFDLIIKTHSVYMILLRSFKFS